MTSTRRADGRALGLVALLAALGLAAIGVQPGAVRAQACPPYCETPIVTPAWHLHMCDESYQEQLDDNHCMRGPGMVEFPAGTDQVHVIYCHKYSDTVVIQIKDSGGGLQWVNHPDGETYTGTGCESLVFAHRNGIPSAGSPYYTSAYWPEGPFNGIGAGIEWFIGLFVAFDLDVYYGKDAEAIITARDPAANQDPTRREEITVRVTSQSDPTGIAVVLREEASAYPLFRAVRPLRFSTIASDEAQGIIKVSPRDVLTVSYCPRDCAAPYTDTAAWYQLDATITPTPLATWAGPPPTRTPTPEPGRRVEYVTLRPAPADVGYAPQISTNKGRPNHLGYPSMYVGMWTRGTNSHFGMAQFDLSSVPEGVTVVDARLELVGRESKFTKPGAWAVKLLDRAIDGGWRDATYDQLRTVPVLAQIGPTLDDSLVAVGRKNAFGFSPDQLALLQDRVASTRRISFRVDGPGGDDNNLFAWHTGVDVYNREPEPPDPSLGPVLHLAYEIGPTVTPTRPGGEPASATPLAPASPTPTTPPPVPGTASATVLPGTSTPTPGPGTASVTPLPPGTVAPTAGPGTASATARPGSSTPTPGPGTASVTPLPPGTVAPTAGPGTTPSATPAGPAETRQVCLVAYTDANGNGTREPEERFLAGVTVRLTHVRSGAFVSRTTEGTNDPDYCWDGLINGDYALSVATWPGEYQGTGPAEWRFTVPYAGPPVAVAFGGRRGPAPTASATATPSATVTATARATDTPAPTPTDTPQPTVVGPAGDVCVAVFNDRDGDRFQSGDELLVGRVEVILRPDDGVGERRVRTRADGPVCLRLPVGVYHARADIGPGWEATGPEEQSALVTLNGRQQLLFGQRQLRPTGQVFLPFCLRPRPATPTAAAH